MIEFTTKEAFIRWINDNKTAEVTAIEVNKNRLQVFYRKIQ